MFIAIFSYMLMFLNVVVVHPDDNMCVSLAVYGTISQGNAIICVYYHNHPVPKGPSPLAKGAPRGFPGIARIFWRPPRISWKRFPGICWHVPRNIMEKLPRPKHPYSVIVLPPIVQKREQSVCKIGF